MFDLIRFETFAEPWRYAQLTNPYHALAHNQRDTYQPGIYAASAIQSHVDDRNEIRRQLWDSGDFVYGLS
jgi:hypothetical protein